VRSHARSTNPLLEILHWLWDVITGRWFVRIWRNRGGVG
jgi:hypothetical protein